MYFWLRLISILRTASEILFVFCVFTKSGTGGGGWCHLNGGTLLDSTIVIKVLVGWCHPGWHCVDQFLPGCTNGHYSYLGEASFLARKVVLVLNECFPGKNADYCKYC